jgi:hypothetical protein
MKKKIEKYKFTTNEYRLVHRPKSEPLLGYWIAEVWYDESGGVVLYGGQAGPEGDIPDETYENMCNMMKAFDQEPLNLDYVDYLLLRKDIKNEG